MTQFTFHDDASVPEAARPMFDKAKAETGRVANIYRYMAESPELLGAYQHLRDLFFKTSFTRVEQELIQLVISFEHECKYCMAVHSMRAKMAKADEDTIAALRAGTPLADARLEALRRFTRKMVEQRGWMSDADIDGFLAAGYTRQNVLEVVLGVGMKVLTNYSNHLFEAPLDEPLKPMAWSKPKSQAAE